MHKCIYTYACENIAYGRAGCHETLIYVDKGNTINGARARYIYIYI